MLRTVRDLILQVRTMRATGGVEILEGPGGVLVAHLSRRWWGMDVFWRKFKV